MNIFHLTRVAICDPSALSRQAHFAKLFLNCHCTLHFVGIEQHWAHNFFIVSFCIAQREAAFIHSIKRRTNKIVLSFPSISETSLYYAFVSVYGRELRRLVHARKILPLPVFTLQRGKRESTQYIISQMNNVKAPNVFFFPRKNNNRAPPSVVRWFHTCVLF